MSATVAAAAALVVAPDKIGDPVALDVMAVLPAVAEAAGGT